MNKSAGFTLIELVVTVTIVGILAMAASPLAAMSIKRQKESELRAALRDLRTAIDAYHQAAIGGRIYRTADESGYPHSLDELVRGVVDLKSPKGEKIYFLRRLPRDPFYQNPSDPIGATSWGLRSYASAPDMPEAGEDVFDIYSLSPGVGMNGVPYRDW